MSRLKRSRALRRNLRKQARKGTLSAREQKTLLQQEKRFRKARRPFMKGLGFGAGLGAGAAAFLGASGIAQALAQGLITKRQADDLNQELEEDQERSQGEMMEEKPSNEVVEGSGSVEDVVVVGEDEQEEGEDAAEERQATPEDQARAERAAQRAEKSREAGVDAALEAGLGGAESPGGDLEEAERQAAQVEGVRDSKYYGTTLPASYGFPDTYDRRKGRPFTEGKFEDFDPTRDLQLGGSEYSEGEDERFRLAMRAPQTDYTGGFDFLPADDPMRSLAPILPQQIDRGASEMGGTPKSQARSQVQQAANEAARLRMEDAAARGQEYNKLLNQVLDNAALVGENPLLGDPGILRALRGFGRRGGRRSSGFAEGGRIDKSNDLVARIKRKYGLR